MVAQEKVEGVRVLAPEEVRCHEPEEQRYFKGQESQKNLHRERPTNCTGVFFLQIGFLRVA